ncbi:hypothetical protein [Candidatus Korobacter versatilis]|uniref:hypothetical protein n=1 Tax=Candidatus Korobacter versatilis TaxID=658062 RepID=UPI00031216E2|nr:hypothetical protein [Candidatus Koribacter versatilis]
MAQMQQGDCAFSNACMIPGERQALAGTNRRYCPVHIHSFELPSSAANGGTEHASVEFRPNPGSGRRRRSNWLTMEAY